VDGVRELKTYLVAFEGDEYEVVTLKEALGVGQGSSQVTELLSNVLLFRIREDSAHNFLIQLWGKKVNTKILVYDVSDIGNWQDNFTRNQERVRLEKLLQSRHQTT
jgi:hypothetical protein